MSITSPMKESSQRDPFELDRLAEELVTREQASSSTQLAISDYHLPLHVPLSHENKYLAADEFNVEEFLLSRSYTSLPDLRSELRDYLANLKEELVQLINDDYEAFITLSTDLRGEGARLERLRHPLGYLKSQILESRSELDIIQKEIQEKLERRTALREEKTLLHLLLKISESLTRLESLLLIAQPEQDSVGSSNVGGLNMPQNLSPDDPSHDHRSRDSRAKHLGRVAGEYTQLLYHASKARAEKCTFVDEIQWRINRIQSTLSSDLDHLFATTLVVLVDDKRNKKLSEIDRSRLKSDLSECLRTYDVLGLWRDAEDVLRTEIVRPFVKKTIHSGALTTPLSPIVPHTPMQPGPNSPSNGNHYMRAPHTHLAPFASNLSDMNRGTSLHLLDDTEDMLAQLYNQILRFVERDLKKIMEIADKVSVYTSSHHRAGEGCVSVPRTKEVEGTEVQGFHIFANVVWAEIGKAVMDGLGGTVFAAGRPNEFRLNHETTRAFIRLLESFAPSKQSIEAMRSHPVYIAFERRWQLPVYFQLRWKEIVTKLEEVLSAPRADGKHTFASAQAEAVWDALSTCWSDDVYIPSLCPRFWRLTLQILSRYKVWLDDNLPPPDALPKISVLPVDKPSNSHLPRSPTPVPSSEAPSAEAVAAEDAILSQSVVTILDIKSLDSKVTALWRDKISKTLPTLSDIGDGDALVKPGDALEHSLAALKSHLSSVSSQIITVLTKRCYEGLTPVRFIPSQFRAMVTKRMPTEPSYFVVSILHPLKTFFALGTQDGPGASLRQDFLKVYAEDVFDAVCQRYMYYLSAMKKTEESLRRLKKGQTSTFSLFRTASNAKDDESRDQERIRAQMIIDVNAFGKDAESMGVNIQSSRPFASLVELVHADTAEDGAA